MAWMNIKYLATSIMMQMHLSVFIPETVFCAPGSEQAKEMKVLWLLHGEGGDCSDFSRLSMVEHYAQKNNLALIIPNMDNSMYMDMAHGAYPYFSYMLHELPPYIQSLLTILPVEREKNFVAGVMSGGYGAVKWALTSPEKFAGCACISGELDIAAAIAQKEQSGMLTDALAAAYGNESFVKNNGNDLLYLAERTTNLPEIYLSNSTNDESLQRNIRAVKKLTACGISIKHNICDCAAGWDFYNHELESYIRIITG